MFTTVPNTNISSLAVQKYGAAAKYDFDNPQKWVTVLSVPLLDEHEMTDDKGRPVAQVDRSVLEQIAHNNNQRVRQTGDPATLILGHTSNDPDAPEKPARGFAVNYHVKPYKRDPNTGQVIYAIHGDFKVRPRHADIIEDYPRRSVELWWNKKELDPIALLGGTSPERDLSVIVRNARLNHISFDKIPSDPRLREAISRAENVLKFSTRGNWTIETYNCPASPTRYNCKPGMGGKSMGKIADNNPRKYDQFGAGDTDDLNDYDPGDEMPEGDGEGVEQGDDDPMVAKVFQSKQWKELSDKLDMILSAIEGPAQGAGEGMEPLPGGGEGGGMDEMPPPGGAGGGMGGGDGFSDAGSEGGMGGGSGIEEESRRGMGEKPVQFMDGGGPPSTGFGGPTSTSVPGFAGSKGKKFSKNGNGRSNTNTPKKGEPMIRRPNAGNANPETAALRRELNEMKLKYARSEAAQIVNSLENEGVIFGDSPEEREQSKAEHTEYFAYLGMQSKEDLDHEVGNVRKHYKRKKANPASPSSIGLARYARNPEGNGKVESDEDWEPTNPMEASAYADLITEKKLSRGEAIKFMRKNRDKFEQYDEDVQHERLR